MQHLLRNSTDTSNPSAISAILATDAENIKTILAKSAAEAAAAQLASSTPSTVVAAKTTTRADPIDAADRANILIQSVIGAKEGATGAILAKVGTRVTDAALRTSDGVQLKSVNEYELFDLINAIMQAAVRPLIGAIRRRFIEFTNYEFDFRIRFASSVAELRSLAAKLNAYGIMSYDNHLAIIILAVADRAAREPFGGKIETAMDRVQSQFP